ncbi:MAG: right-handed parallel beta-helix repeat-containing protein [Thermoplasmata archaeon]|nr:right-handed parallel beta-helix repeat-containing protein [Thermoplasmata archaeon]
MKRKCLAVGIILLFVGTCIIPAIAQDIKKPLPASRSDWLYVGGSGPGNYTRIQDAIDASSNGDTIIVYSGSYYEAINMNKQLFMRGVKLDGQDFPIINGGDDHTTVTINNDSCSFESFIVRNGPAGFLQKAIHILSDYNTIKNCTIYNTGSGVYLSSSCGNFIYDNEIKDGGARAIGLYSSCNNSIFNNNLHDHDNHEILFSDNSTNNRFYHNYVHRCTHNPAIEIEQSPFNIIEENNISGNYEGLVIKSSKNTSVLRNLFTGDGVLVSGTLEELCSNIFIDNLVDGKPLRYYLNQNGITVPADTGQVILINCSYFSIKNFNFIGAEHGIVLFSSSYNSITDNTISAGPAAIQLSQSHDNFISGNMINGGRGGIILSSSNRNIISNNTVQNQSKQPGICLSSSNNNKIIDNVVINSRIGISIESSNYNEIIRNNVTGSTWWGVRLDGSNNYVFNNVVSNCSSLGFRIAAKSTSIEQNFISKCETGIGFLYSESNNITRNVISSNNIGMSLSVCSDMNIFNNHISDNHDVGITISFSDNIVIEKNNIMRNNPNALFTIRLLALKTNKIKGNYWGLILIGLKIIPGTLNIHIYDDPFTGEEGFLALPWLYFDWHPAQEPYDIGG